MNQIEKVSSYLIAAVNALLFIVPLYVATQWLFVANPLIEAPYLKTTCHEWIHTPEGPVNSGAVHWTPPARLIGFCADFAANIFLLMGLMILRKLFQNYRAHEIFSAVNAQYYKKLGALCCLQALLAKPLSGMLLTIAATINNPPGHRYVSLSFGTPNIALLFCGACILVISWVMQEASTLHDEQRFTI